MNAMKEVIGRAVYNSRLLLSDLDEAIKARPLRPEGPSIGDRALLRLLTDAVAKVREVDAMLVDLHSSPG